MYTKVECKFWTDEKMRNVGSDERTLMLYLLTSPHRNMLGFYFLPIPYACCDLGWSEERFNKPFEKLIEIGLIKYDHKTSLVLVKNYLKYNKLENSNQVKGAIDKLKTMPQSPLNQDLASILKGFGKPFLQPLIEQLAQPVTVYSNSIQDTEDDIYNAPAREEEKTVDNSQAEEILDIVQQEFGLLNNFSSEIVKDWINHFPRDWVINAIKKSKGKNVQYADKIMRTWLKEGHLPRDKPWEQGKTVFKKELTGLDYIKRKRADSGG